MTRLVRQGGADGIFALDIALAFKQEHEKRFLLHDGSADTTAKLVAVVVVLRDAVEIVEPATGIKRRVVVCPEYGSMEIIGSRTGHHADLPDTARCLCIYWGGHDLDFLDQIGTRVRNGPRAVFKPPCRNVDAVSGGVHRAQAAAGKVADHLIAAALNAGRGRDQTEHVADSQRQVPNLVFEKD